MTIPDESVPRDAARRFVSGEAVTIDEAIHLAVTALGASGSPPTRGQVRRHIQAMSMQAMGDVAYRRVEREILEATEALMTLLDESFDDVDPHLVGRAARGHVDADTTLHVRLLTSRSVGDLAECLVTHGYTEPAFETADTRWGRLDRMRIDVGGVVAVLTRCPLRKTAIARVDLFSGRAIEVLDLRGLRRLLNDLAPRDAE